MIIGVITCKGRLAHLKRSLPLAVKQFGSIVLVDWDCPDGAGAWASSIPQVHCLNIEDKPSFHKAAALNIGARAAIQVGATRLVFIDADTLLITPIRAKLEALDTREIAIARLSEFKYCQLLGFLSCSVGSFQAVGGFNEDYIGWGYEDLDMRLRLLTNGGCRAVFLPETDFATIKHDTELRYKYQTDSIVSSAARNRKLFQGKLRERLADHWSRELKEALPFK